MNEFSEVSTVEVRSIANELGIAISDEESQMIRDVLRNEKYITTSKPLKRYFDATERSLSEVVVNPDEEDDPLNAYITKCELSLENSPNSRLNGITIAIKDNIAVGDVPMTCGSTVFQNVVPEQDATVITRLLSNGATIVGKTNMDELAYGSKGENSQYGVTRNPRDTAHIAGGSSSGSAALVAAEAVDGALGSDTGGSVRIPASFCGVVGFKPSWGVISRFGFIQLSYALDTIGTITGDVATSAKLLDSIAGWDPRDFSTRQAEGVRVGEFSELTEEDLDIGDLSFGVPEEFFASHISPEVKERVQTKITEIEENGATVESVSIPAVTDAFEISNTIIATELAAYLSASGINVHWNGSLDTDLQDQIAEALGTDADAFGSVVRQKSIEGAYLLYRARGSHYVRAQSARHHLREQFVDTLQDFDALVTPTLPTVAPELDEWQSDTYGEGIASNTRPANLAGLPAITVPAGTVRGLPVGIQFIGGAYDDGSVLQIGRAFERFRESEL